LSISTEHCEHYWEVTWIQGTRPTFGLWYENKVENGSHAEDQIEWINHKKFAEERENRNIKSSNLFEMPFKICLENVTGPGM